MPVVKLSGALRLGMAGGARDKGYGRAAGFTKARLMTRISRINNAFAISATGNRNLWLAALRRLCSQLRSLRPIHPFLVSSLTATPLSVADSVIGSNGHVTDGVRSLYSET